MRFVAFLAVFFFFLTTATVLAQAPSPSDTESPNLGGYSSGSTPSVPVYVPGPQGQPGEPGAQGIPGLPGRPPTKEEVEEAVIAYLNSSDNQPAPAWAKPILEEAVTQGLVVGYTTDGKDYRWARPATRGEVAVVVDRAWVKTQAALKAINGRLDGVEEANRRQDGTLLYLLRELGLLKQDQEGLRSLMENRSWLFLLLVAAAFFAGAAGIRRLRTR